MKVYIASPFFTNEQITRVEEIERSLDAVRNDVYYYSPRCSNSSKMYATLENMNSVQAFVLKKQIFSENLNELDSSDALIANIEGLDSGTLFELGRFAGFKSSYKLVGEDALVRETYSNIEICKNIVGLIQKTFDSAREYKPNIVLDVESRNPVYVGEVGPIINFGERIVLTILAETGMRLRPYFGASKLLLGMLSTQYTKDEIMYIDVPRKSNIMLTQSCVVKECNDLVKVKHAFQSCTEEISNMFAKLKQLDAVAADTRDE